MKIPQDALFLAGFALAHALWSASDLESGENLVPLAFVLNGSTRELHRFEASTQAKAIELGKGATDRFTSEGRSWVFARDGIIREHSKPIDVITVESWTPELDAPFLVLQRYEAFALRRRFRVIPPLELVVGGRIVEATSAEPALNVVRDGVMSHSKVAELLPSWQGAG